MDKEYSARVSALFQRARQDTKYAKMEAEYKTMEEQYSQMVMQLPQNDQDLAWAFVCLSNDMNWRMLEILLEDRMIQS